MQSGIPSLYVFIGVLGAPTEKRLHYVVEFQQAVFEILVLDTAQLAQPAFAFQKACEFLPFERNVELALRHFEPELVLDKLHRGGIQNKQTVVQIKNLLLVHQLHVDWRIALNKGRLFCDGPQPVNPVVSAMLVLGDKDEQFLVFLGRSPASAGSGYILGAIACAYACRSPPRTKPRYASLVPKGSLSLTPTRFQTTKTQSFPTIVNHLLSVTDKRNYITKNLLH